MLLLTTTTHKIQLITDAAADIEATASYIDNASGTITPGGPGSLASITTAATTDIVGSPAASTQRNVTQLGCRNNHASTNVNVTWRFTDGTNTNDLIKVLLLPGEALIMDENGDWAHYDNNGGVYSAGVAQQFPSLMISPGYGNASLTGVKTITSGSSFAVYMGKATKAATSCQVRARVTTAAATITWAEVAIAKGPINLGGNPTLTVVGFADVSATYNSTGQKSTVVNLSAGQTINPGDDLWIIMGNNATTAAIVRAQSIADDIQAGIQASVASRPSTIVGTPTAFTIEGATILAAWVALFI